MSFIALFYREPRALAFGLLHTLAATVGQTFVISLFLPGVKESFTLGDAQVSLLFTTATLISAAALWKIGGWIDRVDHVTQFTRFDITAHLVVVAGEDDRARRALEKSERTCLISSSLKGSIGLDATVDAVEEQSRASMALADSQPIERRQP